MTIGTLVCLVGAGFLGTVQDIDTFQYADANAARHVWDQRAESGTGTPLNVVSDQGRPVLELTAPFASEPKLGRVYIDRKVKLNLAPAGGFLLDVFTDVPEASGRLSLYFHSKRGWYSAGKGFAKKGWDTLRFSKAAFSIEDNPVGWHEIDTIRIAIWRGQTRDLKIRFRRLAATQHDVALIIPSGDASAEHKAARKAAEDVSELLGELGLGTDAIDDQALIGGALGDRRVAILAYNPKLPNAAIDALVEFVGRGGKVFLCYGLPNALGKALGFSQPKYVGRKRSGQFAEVRFRAKNIIGLPKSMRQSSWNITAAKPAGFGARVIAEWFDEDGKPTGLPAMLLSDRGAFFSHIILRDDLPMKKQMLAAVLGSLDPALWEQMANRALDKVVPVGHLTEIDALVRFLKASSDSRATDRLDAGLRSLNSAKQKLADGAYPEAVSLAGEAHRQLCRAYMLAQPSPKAEGRAFWNHSGTGAYPGDWDRTAKELVENGFNMVLPNMLWGGRAHFPSDVLPRSRTYQQYGDQIAQCLAAAKKYGLEVHVWKVNFNLSGAPKAFVQKIHREHRNQVSVDGKAHDWLCPSNPENFKLELASMLEVVRKYDVDGIHFDYIRYPGRDKCYCDGCRKRFEEQTGHHIANWPKDCYSGPLREAYTQWRCDQITRVVKAVHDGAKKIRPDIKISAAVFGAYPACRESVAQDWPEWIKAGYLDFVCPMDYTQSDMNFIGLVTNQLKLIGGRIPLYPGIGQWRLPDDRTVGQIYLARKLGASGFTIFNLTAGSIESTAPAIGLGAGKQKAVPPHDK